MLQAGVLQKCFERMQNYQKDNIFCDIILNVNGEKWKAHKIVLASSSEYFRRLFTSKMKEEHQEEIVIKGISTVAFSVCFDHMYGKNINVYNDYNMVDILEAADMFHLTDLTEKCVNVLNSDLNADNCVVIYCLADRYSHISENLKRKAETFICINAETLLTDPDTLNILPEEIMKFLLSCEQVIIPEELDLLKTLEKWINYNKQQRSKHYELLSSIKSDSLPQETVSRLNCHNTCSKKYFSNSGQSNKTHFQLQSAHQRPRSSCHRILVHNLISKKLQIYDFNNQLTIEHIHSFNNTAPELHNYTLGIAEGKLYSINNKGIFHCVDSYGATQLPRLKDHNVVDITSATFISHKNKLYFIGGCNRKQLKLVNCYDPGIMQWQVKRNLNHARSRMASCVHAGRIYIIGGWNGTNLNSVERYNSEEDCCEDLPGLREGRHDANAYSFGEKIFVAGGNKYGVRLSSVEVYNDKDSTWTKIADLNVPRILPGICTVKNKLIVFGGDRKDGESLCEFWSEKHDTWQQIKIQNDSIKNCVVFTEAERLI